MKDDSLAEFANEEQAPPGRSFVIGCFIGLGLTILASLFILTLGRQYAFERSALTRTLLTNIRPQLEALKKSGKLPIAKGTGSDFSGQEALRKAGVSFPKESMNRGLFSDGWEHPFVYRCHDSKSYQFYSCGPNGRDDQGTFDDLSVEKK